jgi:glycosyltransferase involved in cell wall biosynthesis
MVHTIPKIEGGQGQVPLVSVIIPTFNRARFLPQAVESVLGQSFVDFELLVVDDGSTDCTPAALSPYMGHLRYLRQENRGVSASRNRGIHESRGELVAFLDSDDSWHKDKLKHQVNYFSAHPEAVACYTDEIWIRRGRRVNPKKRHAKYSGYIFEKVLPLCIISPSSVMLKRSVFEKVGLFDENLPACEDYDMWLRVAHRYHVHFIPRPLITKRNGHHDQLSAEYRGLDRFRVKSLGKMLSNGRLTARERALVLEQMVKRCTILSEGCLRRGKTDEWLRYRVTAHKYEKELVHRGKFKRRHLENRLGYHPLPSSPVKGEETTG